MLLNRLKGKKQTKIKQKFNRICIYYVEYPSHVFLMHVHNILEHRVLIFSVKWSIKRNANDLVRTTLMSRRYIHPKKKHSFIQSWYAWESLIISGYWSFIFPFKPFMYTVNSIQTNKDQQKKRNSNLLYMYIVI